MSLTRREQEEHDAAIAAADPEQGWATVNGMPKHVYVPEPGPREDGSTCQFIFMEGSGTARCRSTFMQHARMGWLPKQGGSR